MPTYKLTYFGITALGEPVRAAMALAGIPFENEAVTGAMWGGMKTDPKSHLFGKQLPCLEITDDSGAKTHLFQSRAILRYVGHIGKYDGKPLYPADPMAAYWCDEAIDMVEDMRPLMAPSFAIEDQKEKEAMRAGLVAKDGKMYPHLEKLNARVAKFPFCAGDAPTIADIYVVIICHMFQQPTFLDGFPADTLNEFPNITALKNKLMALPPLAAYYKDAEGIRAPFKVA